MPKAAKGLTGWLERAFYPNYTSEDDLFWRRVQAHLGPGSVVLDAGCGTGTFPPVLTRPNFLVGCDLAPRVGSNGLLDGAARADLSHLPFRDAAFDVVFSRYVAEHLEAPTAAFRELARVLRPGGHLVVLTPNAHHYVTVVSRWTPHRFHEWVARVRGNEPEDAFRTFYRANTRRALTQLTSSAGLEIIDYCAFETKPNYLMMSAAAYAAGIVYERLVNSLGALRALRVSIVVVARRVL